MLYSSGKDFIAAANKRVLLFGMSGLGKTHLANMLRDAGPEHAGPEHSGPEHAGPDQTGPAQEGPTQIGHWFHYSVDYRIGTRYMNEYIADNFKREAMKVPLLRELLMSDSVYIASNITFANLAPLSTYLGKPGNPELGGVAFAEYVARQAQHRAAEIAALHDTARFIARAAGLYGYQNFVCDTSGSICEVVNPEDPACPVLTALQQNLLLVWIKGSDGHKEALVRRFDRAPKPMYYQPTFLQSLWAEYLAAMQQTEAQVDPDAFLRFGYARLLEHRQPRYAALARWGVTVLAEDVAAVQNPSDFNLLIARALDLADTAKGNTDATRTDA